MHRLASVYYFTQQCGPNVGQIERKYYLAVIMATINYLIRSEKNLASIYLRFRNGRKIDIKSILPLMIKPEHWSKPRKKVKPQFATIERSTGEKININSELQRLSDFYLKEMNISMLDGIHIDKYLSDQIIDRFFNITGSDEKKDIYFVDWAIDFTELSSKRLVQDANGNTKKLSKTTIGKYNTTINKLKDYEKEHGTRLKFMDINLKFYYAFLEMLTNDQQLAGKTCGSYIRKIKLFCNRAALDGKKIHPEHKHPDFIAPDSESVSVYLTEPEINRLYNCTLPNERFKNIRDLLIIGVWTALRANDLFTLNEEDIDLKNDRIFIRTSKTGAQVEIPLHPQVKEILIRRGGLPEMKTGQEFNRTIKEVCKIAGLNQLTRGGLINPETKRKEIGHFPKYKLVSSHIGRRSFCTNLYGKLPDLTIMAISGHKSRKQFLEYIKTTGSEHADKVMKHWDSDNGGATMNVVKSVN